MSENSGTYVLKTTNHTTGGYEFRLAHLPAVDNLFDEYNATTGKWTPNIKSIVESFRSSKVYTTLDSAWDAAEMVDNTVGSEYGTNLIGQFSDYAFPDLEDEYAKAEGKTS